MKRRGPKPRAWRSVEQTVGGRIDHSRSVAAEHKTHGGAEEQGCHVALNTEIFGGKYALLATGERHDVFLVANVC